MRGRRGGRVGGSHLGDLLPFVESCACVTGPREHRPAGSRPRRGESWRAFPWLRGCCFLTAAVLCAPELGTDPSPAVPAGCVIRGHGSETAASPPDTLAMLLRGERARGGCLRGRTPRTWRWRRPRGPLGQGVRKAAARLQTWCFWKSRAGGSPLSAEVRFLSAAPRSVGRLLSGQAGPERGDLTLQVPDPGCLGRPARVPGRVGGALQSPSNRCLRSGIVDPFCLGILRFAIPSLT